MEKNKILSFKETMVEGDYLKTLTKEQKKEYKKKPVDEKRKIIHEFNPEKFQTSNDGGNKFINWIKKHKILSGFIALIIIIGMINAAIEGDIEKSDEPKKETANKKDAKSGKAKSEPKKEKAKPKSENKKPLTDKQKLNKQLKKEVHSAEVKNVDFGVGASDVTIELKGKENLSNKMTSRGFRMGTSEALYAIKKSHIDVNSADILVYYPLNDGMKDEEKMVMSSRWDKSKINEMNQDALDTLPNDNNIESNSESSFIHPSMRKSEK